MKWNSELYNDKHGFVAEYGKALVEKVPNNKNQTILDLGCGTGSLTYELSKKCKKVIGIDSSSDMLEKAKSLYSEIEFYKIDALDIAFEDSFDIVFSNAVFHWIKNQKVLLTKIYTSLRSNGKLICEFGASGNIETIENSFAKITRKYGYTYQSNMYFPTKDEYKSLLESIGFNVQEITVYERPTPLDNEIYGLRNWIKQFLQRDLSKFPDNIQEKIIQDVEVDIKDKLWNGTNWVADYVRIQVIASKNI